MYEHIFTRAALNEAISLCAIEPLDCALFLHDKLLSALQIKQYSSGCDDGPDAGVPSKPVFGSLGRKSSHKRQSGFQRPSIFRGDRWKGKEAGIRTRRYVAADCTSTHTYLRHCLPAGTPDASRTQTQPAPTYLSQAVRVRKR
jgi:hypothetical protein